MKLFNVEKVECCVCGASGKVRRWLVLERDCPTCDGTGKRSIIVPAQADAHTQFAVRQAARLGTVEMHDLLNIGPGSFLRYKPHDLPPYL